MPDLSWENRLGGVVAGVDEVGRGCLAGPVVAAVAVLGKKIPQSLLELIDDSKKLSSKKRQYILSLFSKTQTAIFSLGSASVEEIDQLNILKASHLAMRRAVEAIKCPVEHLLIDGNQKLGIVPSEVAITGGDRKSLSIASASIFAKEKRDAKMCELDKLWPGYGWSKNMGYGTKAHRQAIKELGRTPYHRLSFGAIKEYPKAKAW